MSDLTTFPPAYGESPLMYGGALFGLLAISCLFMAVLADFWLMRAHADRQGKWWLNPGRMHAPLLAYRGQIVAVALMAVLGTLPDVLYLLSWGETPTTATYTLVRLDRTCDFMSAVPGAYAAISFLANRQSLEHRLEFGGGSKMPGPTSLIHKVEAKRYLKVVALAFIIAAGVTAGKASA